MKVILKGLYGLDNGTKAYYRKQGKCCFDFVGDVQFASDLTIKECVDILSQKGWYMRQYNASEMLIED